jgi:ketosteroid isomerase-like protein
LSIWEIYRLLECLKGSLASSSKASTGPGCPATARDFRRARRTRDPRQIAPFLDDDVDWLLTGPIELISFGGQRRGKGAVLDCLTRQHPAVLAGFKVELAELLIDGNRRQIGVQRSTGRTVSYNQAQLLLYFRDGKIVKYRGIIDSFNAAEQIMGHPVALPQKTHATDDSERVGV